MFYTDFSKSDFPEMAWISKENYTGVQKVGDKDAFVFKMEFVVPGEPPETIVRTAAIDVATQLPIYATEQNRMQVYRFDATPAAPLSVPQKVNDALEAQRKFESPTGK
jgi:hypothetical protein